MTLLPRDENGRWHPLLLPETDDEKLQAIEALQRATTWQLAPRELLRLLDPWFDRGWCPKAILHGMDWLPSGQRQPNYRYDDHTHLIETRMRAWIDGLGNLRPPPVESSDPEALAARQRDRRARTAHGRGATRATDPLRQQIRDGASEAARRHRWDAVERARTSADRITAALDALGPGVRLAEPEEDFHPDGMHWSARERERDTAARRVSGMDRVTQEIQTAGRVSAPMMRALRARYGAYRQARALDSLDELLPKGSPA